MAALGLLRFPKTVPFSRTYRIAQFWHSECTINTRRSIMAAKTNNEIPKLRPTPLTWLYIVFGIAVIVFTVWGMVTAASP